MNHILLQDISTKGVVRSLEAGRVVVYPTETCYGIGCDATNDASVQKIVQIKHRREGHPFLLLFKDISHLRSYVQWDETVDKLAKQYWPGALTIVLPLSEKVTLPEPVIGEYRMIACRISNHPFVQELFSIFESPLVSTSANISGEPAFYDAKNCYERFLREKNQPDIIIDAGVLPHNPSSTIIRLQNGRIEILRQGMVQVSEVG